MNNPEDNSQKNGIDEGAIAADFAQKIVEIESGSLIVSDSNSDFINDQAAYRVFERSDRVSVFLTDLNSSSEILTDKEYKLVQTWIKNIKDHNINYTDNNLLFYPLQTDEDCGLKVSVTVQGTNGVIELKSTKIQCKQSQIYHALFFSVSKEIESVKFKIFDKKDDTVLNSAN